MSSSRLPSLAALSASLLLAGASCTAPRLPAGSQGCLFSRDCADGLVCVDRFCRTRCQTDRDCPASQRCGPTGNEAGERACLPPDAPPYCVLNSECPQGQLCGINGQCVVECATDYDCQARDPSFRCLAAVDNPAVRTCQRVLLPSADASPPDAMPGMDAALDAPSADALDAAPEASPPDAQDAQDAALEAAPEAGVDAQFGQRPEAGPGGFLLPPVGPGALSSDACANPALVPFLGADGLPHFLTDLTFYSATSAQQPPAGCSTATRVVVGRYTMQRAGHLVVSTAGPGTDAFVVPSLWVREGACATGAAAGCALSSSASSRGVLQSTRSFPAGATVWVFAGVGPNPTDAPGVLELVLREVPEVSVGAPCRTDGSTGVCAGLCLPGDGGLDGTCVTAGAVNTPCRPVGTACDAGLFCDPSASRCAAYTPVGGACSTTSTASQCVAGAECTVLSGATAGVCRVRGSAGAYCRMTSPACDGALGCTFEGYCGPVVPAGGVCDPSYVRDVCVPEAGCRADTPGGSTGHCLAGGTRGAPCRATLPYCDAGLGCNNEDNCAPLVPVGAACDTSYVTSLCEPGNSCTAAAVCAALGTEGAECRDAPPECDASLACSPDSFLCVRVIPSGGACDPSGAMNLCEAGTNCGPDSRCHPPGQLYGQCLRTLPRCPTSAGCGSAGFCIPFLYGGQPCDPTEVLNRCVSGRGDCQLDSATMRYLCI